MSYVDLAYTRVYLPHAKVSHLLHGNASPNLPDAAACGVMPRVTLWHGTGNWDEMERAKRLPICPGCAKALRLTERDVA